MKKLLFKIFILTVMLLGLPMLGIVLADLPVRQYLEFPPDTIYVTKAPFSWIAFILFAVGILATVGPLLIICLKTFIISKQKAPKKAFPLWGWAAAFFGFLIWFLAWNRFECFSSCQPHTFVPLWLCYIVVVNALTYKNTGKCMLVHRPRYFTLLFPISAGFWWFFEYLNRFVQNWYYTGSQYGALMYFYLSTLAFSTVLPAVLGTRDWLMSTAWVQQGFNHLPSFSSLRTKPLAFIAIFVWGSGLTFIGVFPDYLFPLLWLSPLVIIVSLHVLMGEKHVFSDIAVKNWRIVISSMIAAFICGIFWETWNFYSLIKWEYSIPFVHGFKIFEMPVLGYVGYLPFGLECATIGLWLEKAFILDSKKSANNLPVGF